MIVLGVVLSCATVVALRVGLARVSALLLDEDALQAGASSSVSDHDLLCIVEHLRVVYAA